MHFQINKEQELQLFKLFHNEREIGELTQELAKKNRILEKENKRKDKIEAEVKEKKKEQGSVSRELTKLEQQIKESVRKYWHIRSTSCSHIWQDISGDYVHMTFTVVRWFEHLLQTQ